MQLTVFWASGAANTQRDSLRSSLGPRAQGPFPGEGNLEKEVELELELWLSSGIRKGLRYVAEGG